MEHSAAKPSLFSDSWLQEEQIGEPFHRFQTLKSSDLPAAVKCFGEFKNALIRRIHWEETEIFPEFQRQVGGGLESTCDALQQEHREVLELLSAIETKLSRANPATEVEEAALQTLLASHNHKEHTVVFPALE
ncbi:MAG: hemerythrin domain-containing protein [Verrucomicrobiae bacterium]|nr:hemerythrin domain-containing protein [Verrucomicrobiae bacterium]